MKKIASMFYSVMIFFTAQNSFGMDEIARNTDLTDSSCTSELLNQKITYEQLNELHQRMKIGISIDEYVKRVYNPALIFYPPLQRVKVECSEWFFIFIEDEYLRKKVGATLNGLLVDLTFSFDVLVGPIAKIEADRHREARLAEQNPRCIENLIIETCLMDLLEWASRERNRDYFFQLKEAFTAWMFDLQSLGEGYDFQKQLENRKGFFRKLFGF